MSGRTSVGRSCVALLGLLAAFACADPASDPTGVDPLFARGGGGPSVSVNDADPYWAPQDTTLDVRIIGSGFDDGSTVRFLLSGQSTPKILTNSSTFVDGNTLIANITVALDAEVALYDVEVMSIHGKKGIGSELFAVTQKGNGPPDKTGDLGTWDGTQDIVYVERYTQSGTSGRRMVVIAPDGSNRAIVYTLSADQDATLDGWMTPDGDSIVFQQDNAVYVISRDPLTSAISAPVFVFSWPTLIGYTALSPDASRFAFSAADPSYFGCQEITALDAWVHDRETGRTTRITTNNECGAPPETTSLAKAWASNTQLAVMQSSQDSPPLRHISVLDVGDLTDADADGVIDSATEVGNTLGSGGPDNMWPHLDWDPATGRGVVATINPQDFWLIDLSGPTIQWCNLTEALDPVEIQFTPTLGPDGQIVFIDTIQKREQVVKGSFGAGCPTSITGVQTIAVDLEKGRDYWYPLHPHWRRPDV